MQDFFIPKEQEFPQYREPLFQEISDIVNVIANERNSCNLITRLIDFIFGRKRVQNWYNRVCSNFSIRGLIDRITNNSYIVHHSVRPFYIDFAQKTEADGKESLHLRGHFVTFDGLIIGVCFDGEYESPENATGFQKTLLSEQNSFGEYCLKARLINASEEQIKLFSRLRLIKGPIMFSQGELEHKPYYGKYSEPNAALSEIRDIGKLVLMYDYLHIEFYLEALHKAQVEFVRQLNQLGHFDYDISFLVKEAIASPEIMSSVLELKHRDQLVLGWVTRLSATIALPFNIAKGLNSNDIALPNSKRRTHDVKFNYSFYYGQWEDVAELASWRVNLDWTIVSELNSFRNELYELRWRKYTHKDKSPIELDEAQSRIFSSFEKFEFIIRAMGIYIEPEEEDFVEDTYKAAFDEQIIKARGIVKRDHPEYLPLYLVGTERPVMQEDSGNISFYSIENYRIFSELMELLLQDPLRPLDEFIELPEFYDAFRYDPILENRAREYVKAFKQDPNNTDIVLNQMDLAYPIAQRLDKEYWERISQKVKDREH